MRSVQRDIDPFFGQRSLSSPSQKRGHQLAQLFSLNITTDLFLNYSIFIDYEYVGNPITLYALDNESYSSVRLVKVSPLFFT